MTEVLAIMPCMGRKEQTIRNVRRLYEHAGRVDWLLYLVSGSADGGLLVDVAREVAQISSYSPTLWTTKEPQLTYWEAMQQVTQRVDAPLVVNLANDLLPGHLWLERGVRAYRARFGDGDGLLGFNDGIHGPGLSPHFMISRGLLQRFGGWPTHYRHNFGDTELCARAQALNLYGKAPWAVLYHDHAITGASDDAVYAAGRATADADARLFERRRASGWTL